jgi:hypothetical protein
MHPYAMIVVDEDATLELQVKTVKVRLCLACHMAGLLTPETVLQVHRASRCFTGFRPNSSLRRIHTQETRLCLREAGQSEKSEVKELSCAAQAGAEETDHPRAGTGFHAHKIAGTSESWDRAGRSGGEGSSSVCDARAGRFAKSMSVDGDRVLETRMEVPVVVKRNR